jgi:hypothetical protein
MRNVSRALIAAGLLLFVTRASIAEAQAVGVSGVVYTHYQYLLSDTAGHGNGFDVNRAYINVRGTFPRDISSRVTVDVFREAGGSLAYRLKYAFVQWSPPGGIVAPKLGMIQTPWVEWEESLWGYRFQGTVALDRAGYLTSADLGAALDFSAGNQVVNGSLALMNGEGYTRPESGAGKDVGLRVSARLLGSDDVGPQGGLRISGYGGLGRLTTGGARNRWLGMVSYKSQLMTLAGEFAQVRDADVDGQVVSTLAVLNIPGSAAALVGRLDRVDSDTDIEDNAFTRIITGASYRFSPNVRLLADVDLVNYQQEILPAATEATRERLLFQVEFTF